MRARERARPAAVRRCRAGGGTRAARTGHAVPLLADQRLPVRLRGSRARHRARDAGAFVALARTEDAGQARTRCCATTLWSRRASRCPKRASRRPRAWLLQILREMWRHCAATGTVVVRAPHPAAPRLHLRDPGSARSRGGRLRRCRRDGDLRGQSLRAALRDMHAVSQQVQASPSHFQSVGQHYLGLKPSTRFI